MKSLMHPRTRYLTHFWVVALVWCATSTHAEDPPELSTAPGPFHEVAKFVPDLGGEGESGHDVAIDGTRILVGSDGEHTGRTSTAYILERSPVGTWELVAVLEPGAEYFSGALDLYGDTAVVSGTRFFDTETLLHVFKRDHGGPGNWGLIDLLGNPEDPTDGFGIVSLDGDRMVVGATGDDTNGLSAGAAYVFERRAGEPTTWQKLVASDGDAQDLFGVRVAVSGDTIVIAAARDEDRGTYAGSAYVFELGPDGEWFEAAKLLGSDTGAHDHFAESVAIDGDRIAVATRVETVYVFERDAGGPGAWGEVAKIPVDALSLEVGLALQGDTLAVGHEHGLNADGIPVGSVTILHRTPTGDWVEVQTLLASDGEEFDYFGTAIDLSGPTLVVGAEGVGITGASYVFEEMPCAVSITVPGSETLRVGETITVSVEIEHRRLDAVTVPVTLWLADRSGEIAVAHTSSPITFGYGDTWSREFRLPVPGNLVPGVYDLFVGVSSMNPDEIWDRARVVLD